MNIFGLVIVFVVGRIVLKLLKKTLKIGFTLFSYGVAAAILTLIIQNIF